MKTNRTETKIMASKQSQIEAANPDEVEAVETTQSPDLPDAAVDAARSVAPVGEEELSPDTSDEQAGGTTDTDVAHDANAEAKRYRLERNAEREAHRATKESSQAMIAAAVEQRDAAHKQLVTSRIASKFNDVDDFWRNGNLDDMRGDDGSVDLDKADAAADQVLQAHPHYGVRQGWGGSGIAAFPGSAVVGGDKIKGTGQKQTWQDVLRTTAVANPQNTNADYAL
jgi:hypothetical protein